MLIKYIIPDDTFVSIVTFSNTASICHQIVQITSDQIRNDLVNSLPINVGGSTSIGAGLQEALSVSRNSRFSFLFIYLHIKDQHHLNVDRACLQWG